MRKKLFCLLCALAWVASPLAAEPRSGFGLYGASSNQQFTVNQDVSPINSGNSLGLGLEYSWPLGSMVSYDLGVYEIASSAKSSQFPTAELIKSNSLWGRFKFWVGPVYLSVRSGRQLVFLVNSKGTGTVSGTKSLPVSFGLGLETDGGLLVDFQSSAVKQIKLADTGNTLDAQGSTLLLGWRF